MHHTRFLRFTFLLALLLLPLLAQAANAAPRGDGSLTYLPLTMRRCARFADDFSDPTSGWMITKHTTYEMNYADGAYRILLTAPDETGSPNENFRELVEDFTATVEIRWEEAPGHEYGLQFYNAPDDGYDWYRVLINPGEQT